MILIFGGFVINTGLVSAKVSSYSILLEGESTEPASNGFSKYKTDCGVFGDPGNPNDFAYYLQEIFNIIRFAAPVLVVLMTIVDLVKVTTSDKGNIDADLKKVGIKTLKRAIFAVILFVLPTLITTIFEFIGLYGTCGIS